ncbi:GNAT family N-acetyltransferase [Nocardioides sp. GXZ039]|uniref:GNAT family N-acetyltransferase n=1 Tax=Nocardioides sp. GXZ039 TaxID=3136018 RepID=UPI0030F3B705
MNERVAAASAAWLWYPDDADAVRSDDALLVGWPDYFRAPPSVLWVSADADADAVLAWARERCAAWGARTLLAWVPLAAPDGWERALTEHGGTAHETVDVFALDLTAPATDLAAPGDVEIRWQDDEETTRAALEIGVAAFDEGSIPPPERVRELAAQAAADHAAGRASQAVGYLEGEPAGSGGVTFEDGVARLWGGGVIPAARGRGVYRAVLAARLDLARRRGAQLALVKGRVDTSGPILRRAGFGVYGQERSYLVPVG